MLPRIIMGDKMDYFLSVDTELLKEKDIVIYGAGNTGKYIYSNLIDLKEVNVIAVVDKNASKIKNTFLCNIKEPKQIICCEKYDYILVASIEENVRKEIKKDISAYGILSEKIIYVEWGIFNGKGRYFRQSNAKILVRQLIQCNEECKNENEKVIDATKWFSDYINDFKNIDELADQARYVLFDENTESLDAQIVCGMLLFLIKRITNTDMKQLLKSVKKLPPNRYDFAFFLVRQIAFMEQEQAAVLYEGIGIDRKIVNKQIVEYFGDNINDEKKSISKNADRVIILVPELLQEYMSASIYYRLLANQLCLSGKIVKVIVVACTQNKGFGIFSIATDELAGRNMENKSLNRKLICSDVEIEYIFEENLHKLFKNIINAINFFEPGCIIDATDENIPISTLLIKRYPIFYFPMRNCSTGYSFTKTYLREFRYNKEIKEKIIPFKKPRLTLNSSTIYRREEKLGLDKTAFMVITVGGRFYNECNEELIDGMVKNLRCKEHMHWILVGVQDKRAEKIFLKYNDIKKKIHIIPWENNLAALYQICDVYLNHDRRGGGFSILFAMEQGLAVAALKKNYSGGAVWCDESELIDGGNAELCKYVGKLYDDRELLLRKKIRMKEIYNQYLSIEEWGKYLCASLDITVKAYYSQSESERYDTV